MAGDLKILPNKSEKILSKFMQVILFALIASALSAFYISQTHAADIVPNEIQMHGTLPLVTCFPSSLLNNN